VRPDVDRDCIHPPRPEAIDVPVAPAPAGGAAQTGAGPVVAACTVAAPLTLERFLADIGARAFRFAELGLRQREDALDAVQDAMMRMLGYQDRPQAEWTPLFWSILRRRIVDLQRRRAFRFRWLQGASDHDDGDIDWADSAPDPSRQHDQRQAYARLADALAALPRRQREAFGLRVLEELDVANTARAMGCSEGSVKTHLSRAREALRRQLEDFQ
jgi:RNA polymerase sigma-70 factor (ECF subfamily)